MVGASFGLQSFTQVRYDLHDEKVQNVCSFFFSGFVLGGFLILVKVSKEQALGLDKNRKKFDIREEYYVRFKGCYWGRSLMTSFSLRN